MLKRRIASITKRYGPAAFVAFYAVQPTGGGDESLISRLFSNGTDLGFMLNTAFQVAINVGAILAMLRIMWAGWLYMGSADMWSNKHHAKEVFQNAIIGLLILLAIWIILNQINPQILNVGAFSTDSAALTPSRDAAIVDTINKNTPDLQYPPQKPNFNDAQHSNCEGTSNCVGGTE